ncbi:RpiB/LacA/LacB family sugar-phosphate isomerase [Candidatus Collierbacteria bacterium]|nr:RpiB/LacA/LacB family sugar-phosphate isomerase [Candidatus Collierbacteria bacterium]
MRIILGADHGGYKLKKEIKKWLLDQKYVVVDIGAEYLDPDDDFVDYAVMVAEEVVAHEGARGILFCRNGFGMMIAANRYKGVRCGEAFDVTAVKRGRTDDDINCLSVPSDYIKEGDVKKMIEVFLKTKVSRAERYKRRLWKLEMVGGGGCGDGGCCGDGGDGGCGCSDGGCESC